MSEAARQPVASRRFRSFGGRDLPGRGHRRNARTHAPFHQSAVPDRRAPEELVGRDDDAARAFLWERRPRSRFVIVYEAS